GFPLSNSHCISLNNNRMPGLLEPFVGNNMGADPNVLSRYVVTTHQVPSVTSMKLKIWFTLSFSGRNHFGHRFGGVCKNSLAVNPFPFILHRRYPVRCLVRECLP